MENITEAVKHIIIINVILFIGTMMMGEPASSTWLGLVNEQQVVFSDWGRLRLALFSFESPYFRPFQIVTHLFMHGDLGHLFFNMLGVFMFGTAMERVWGTQRFLFYYLFTGFGAMLLQLLARYVEIHYFGESKFIGNVPLLGASGAVFGLLAAYGMTFPNNIIMLLIPPIPMKAKYFVFIYAAIELYLGLSGRQAGVAHFAHVGGALFGFLLILYWNRR